MTFNEIMNSPLLYGLVGLGIAYIILFCLITLKKPTNTPWSWGSPEKSSSW